MVSSTSGSQSISTRSSWSSLIEVFLTLMSASLHPNLMIPNSTDRSYGIRRWSGSFSKTIALLKTFFLQLWLLQEQENQRSTSPHTVKGLISASQHLLSVGLINSFICCASSLDTIGLWYPVSMRAEITLDLPSDESKMRYLLF